MNSTTYATVLLEIRIDGDRASLAWLNELSDKAREYGELLTMKLVTVPSDIIIAFYK